MPSSGVPSLSVVIPVLGRHDVLGRVLDGLERQDAPEGSFEVIVAPDAREPELESLRAAVGVRAYAITTLDAAGADGASASRNRGWRAARSELVLFLGADILPSKSLVSEHLSWHGRHPAPEVAVLGSVRWARSLKITPFMRWLEYGIQFGYAGIQGETAGWGHFHTANVSLKRALLERADGFDERFPFLYEDMDLSYRLHQMGYTLLYAAAAQGEHHHPTTLEDYRARIADVARAERRFVAKHPELDPYFHDRFATAGGLSPRKGRTRLLSFVPYDAPVLGKWVWRRIDAHYKQELAPTFLAAWEAGDGG